MNTPITSNAQPLYTFQNRSGDFVDVLARAEYQGESVDLCAVSSPSGIRYVVEGTKVPRQTFSTSAALPTLGDSLTAAVTAFDSERLVTLAAKFGTYEYGKS